MATPQRAPRQSLETDCLWLVETAASFESWSPDHLCRICKAAFHASLSQIQTEARIVEAASMLRTTSTPIAEIAEQCGFPDASDFPRVFKNKPGLPLAVF